MNAFLEDSVVRLATSRAVFSISRAGLTIQLLALARPTTELQRTRLEAVIAALNSARSLTVSYSDLVNLRDMLHAASFVLRDFAKSEPLDSEQASVLRSVNETWTHVNATILSHVPLQDVSGGESLESDRAAA